MAFSPMKTQRLPGKPVWSATRRRREAEKAITDADPTQAPTTVNDGSTATPAGQKPMT